jgi:integrase/recombinase XerD
LAIQAFENYARAGALYGRNTLAAYRSDLVRFSGFIERTSAQPATLANFTLAFLQAFIRAEITAGYHPHTTARRIASLKAFNLYLKEPVSGLEQLSTLLPARRQDKATQTYAPYLQPVNLGALWEVMEQAPQARARSDQELVELLIETGVPLQRLLDINLIDIQADCRALWLMQPTGRKDHLSLLWADQPLRRYLKEGRPELSRLPDEPALWISQGGRRMTRQAVWQRLRGWGRRAGLPFPLSPRLLSDVAAQRLAISGLPLRQIQLRLGHQSTLSTLARVRRISRQSGF